MIDLSGVFIPAVTPFLAPSGDIDLPSLRENLRRWSEASVQGIVLAGTTGEAVLVDEVERIELVRAAKEALPSSILLTVGTGLESTRATTRLTRAVAQTVQRQPFLEAAICLGLPGWRIVTREMLPNVIGPVLVEAAVAFSYAVLLESALSFLGLGAQPPEPSWGNMINTGRGYIDQAPWISLAPGAALFLTVFSFNLLGDGLRDVLDPKLDG